MGVSGMTEEPKRQDKDAQESDENNRWDKIKKFFLDNPTFALTLAYLYVTAIGMLYSAVLYGRFGINIFEHSEIVDFILAAFKNPIAILLGALQGAALALSYYVVPPVMRWWRAKRMNLEPEQEERLADLAKRAYRRSILTSAVLITAFLILFFTYAAADATAFSIEHGYNRKVEVRYRSFSGSAGQVTMPGLQFIGATQRAVFFYDADHKHTIVIPQSQLVSIEVPQSYVYQTSQIFPRTSENSG
jgi:hypothetical protein